jgi:thiol-disulfide isomerase/thioredoxin
VKRAAVLLCAAALGAASPGLTPIDETGFARTLSAHRGQIVLFDFWATWCQPCRAELPQLVELQEKYRGRGFVLLTVSADEPETEAAALQFLEKTGIRPPAYIKRVKNDEAFIDSIDPKWSGALPALFLYDRSGAHTASFFGETDPADIEKALDRLVKP